MLSITAGASCDSEPLVPCRVIAESPTAAFAGTVTVNCCGEFGLTVSGDAGLVVAPAGNPDIATDTVPEKPLKPLTETVIGELVAPWTTESEVVESERLKSGAGGGFELPLPPPQPAINMQKNAAKNGRTS
jgi:hypothetical protein